MRKEPLVQILKPFTEDLLNVGHLLDSLMDEEEMRAENRFTVKTGIMEELDKSKRSVKFVYGL